jgi:hypothetical protein
VVSFNDQILVYCAGLTPSVTALPITDFKIDSDGNILFWNTAKLGTQPSAATLQAITDQQVSAYYAAQAVNAAQSQLGDTSTTNGRILQAIMGAANLTPAHVQARVAGTVSKSMQTLVTAILGLSTTQWNNVLANLFAGNPAPWQLDQGPNITALSAVYVALTNSSGTPVFANKFQQVVVCALYLQDNPTYLVNPTFDPTINISGT